MNDINGIWICPLASSKFYFRKWTNVSLSLKGTNNVSWSCFRYHQIQHVICLFSNIELIQQVVNFSLSQAICFLHLQNGTNIQSQRYPCFRLTLSFCPPFSGAFHQLLCFKYLLYLAGIHTLYICRLCRLIRHNKIMHRL